MEAGSEPPPEAAPADSIQDAESSQDDCDGLLPFDPGDVYLLGELVEGSCGAAIAHWSDPNTALTGFGCYTRHDEAMIRPGDGSLIFAETFDGTYVFRADQCIRWGDSLDYPDEPFRNDQRVPFPCDSGLDNSSLLVGRGGEIAFGCPEGWRDGEGTLIFDGDEEPFAYDGRRLLTETGVFDIADQTLAEFTGVADIFPIAARVVQTGFWAVLYGEDGNDAEFWSIDADAVAVREGVYPPLPQRAKAAYRTGGRMSADGAFFEIARDQEVDFNDLIVRRTISGDSEVIYDELDDPLVKIHISGLITGP